jgi:putative PIN family toxin of toxin-antitoxin system
VLVVLDTNILVSACWKPGGLEAQVTELAIAGKITACVTPEVLAEYCDVLMRPKLAAVRERADELLTAIGRVATQAKATTSVRASIDEDDNRFLECAEAAQAEYLITGNLRHYPELWGVTRVVNARGFFSIRATV